MDTIGSRVKMIREMNCMTQSDLSDVLGSSRSQIASIESGYRDPKDLFVRSFCTYFAVREKWLRTGELPIRDPSAEALKNEFANVYFELSAELAPTFEIPELFVKLLQRSKDYARMFHYLSHRFLHGADQDEPKRLDVLFALAFPHYKEEADAILAGITETEKEKRRNAPLSKRTPVLPAGKVAAGTPIFDHCANELMVELPVKYLDAEHYPSFEVQGDSMEPRLHSGDIVFVERNVSPSQGQIAVVHTVDDHLDDGYLIKKFYKEHDHVKLVSLNDQYPPLLLREDEIVDAQVVVYEVHK